MDLERLVQTFFNWDLWVKSFPHLMSGLKVTLVIAGMTLVIAIVGGLLLALIRNRRVQRFNWLIVTYVDSMRAFPPLVLIVLIFYALPFLGIRIGPIAAAVLSLALNNSAHISEIFRSGIEAVGKGQIDAARALGMSGSRAMMFVILPQAFRIVIPPLTSNIVALVKDTALASVVTVPELLRQARELQALYFNPSPMMAATVVYIVVLWPLVRLTRILERQAKRSGV